MNGFKHPPKTHVHVFIKQHCRISHSHIYASNPASTTVYHIVLPRNQVLW